MFSAKDNADSFAREHTHHTTGGAGGERSELLDSHGRKQAQQTTGEEEDLPGLSNMQLLLLQSDSRLPECWQLWGRGRVKGEGGGGGPIWGCLRGYVLRGTSQGYGNICSCC